MFHGSRIDFFGTLFSVDTLVEAGVWLTAYDLPDVVKHLNRITAIGPLGKQRKRAPQDAQDLI